MKEFQQSIGREKAIELYDSGWWKGKSAHDICKFQMFTAELCMPFEQFHKAVEDALKRPVWTHEFGLNYEGLAKELMGDAPAPSFAEILALLPAENTIVITT